MEEDMEDKTPQENGRNDDSRDSAREGDNGRKDGAHKEPEKIEKGAVRKRVSLVSAVWLVPLAALLAGMWLMFNTISQSGPTITLHIPNAEGMAAGNTVIKILNVNVGRITSLKLDDSSTQVVMKAKMDGYTKKLLNDGTQFYVVKPRIDQTGITGLGTLVSGAYIEMIPGNKPGFKNTFNVSDDPLMVKTGDKGLLLELAGKTDRLLPVGSPVLYKNITIGSVITSSFDPKTLITSYRIFIDHPNEAMVGKNVKFWMASGISIKNDGGGVSISGLPIGALLTGAISMSDEYGGRGDPVENNTKFPLYKNQSDIPIEIDDDVIKLVAFFDESVSSLFTRAPVYYQGIKVGIVLKVPYFLPHDKAKLFSQRFIPVLISVSPKYLADEDGSVDKDVVNQGLEAALDKNLIATLGKETMISSSLVINLENSPKGQKLVKPYDEYGGIRVIATKTAGLQETLENLNGILAQVNQAPITQTIENVNRNLDLSKETIKGINAILNDQSMRSMPDEIRASLVEIRSALEAFGNGSKTQKSLSNTLDELGKTLPKIQTLLDTMTAKPNALIMGDSAKDPEPKGRK